MTTGQKLRKVREIYGYTIEYVALEADIATGTYAGWESDATSPSVKKLMKVAEVYDTDVSDLLVGVGI